MEGLEVMRKQTIRFIQENPAEVILQRPVSAADGAGGRSSAMAPLAAQTFRIVRSKQASSVGEHAVGGEVTRPAMVLITPWDADVLLDDQFEWNAIDYSVTWINDMGYEKMIDVTGRG